jgi:hypothetical protein
MSQLRLYHISENPDIKVFEPRPSPSHYDGISDNVVFAISYKMLHNYLLPRDCPRVTFYANKNSSQNDINTFIRPGNADYIMTVESKWRETIQNTPLYCYELPVNSFLLLDANAGYYISYEKILPISVRNITDIEKELLHRNVELRFIPSLVNLAEQVQQSSLSFSLIRMRNAS